jgi:hypothetical protein
LDGRVLRGGGAIVVLALVSATACEEREHSSGPSNDSDTPAERTCLAPAGLGAPTSIEGVVDLVNALPMPVELPCFLESLDRPFGLYASSSQAGAQPAVGDRSPRLFLYRDPLVMTVVPEGTGAHALELALFVGDRKSVKAEIRFPVETPLTHDAPYEVIYVGAGTSCGTCHGTESRYAPIEHARAYQSDVFQDDASAAIPLGFAQQNAHDCDAELEPQRCAMLRAVFAHGALDPWELPRDSRICR